MGTARRRALWARRLDASRRCSALKSPSGLRGNSLSRADLSTMSLNLNAAPLPVLDAFIKQMEAQLTKDITTGWQNPSTEMSARQIRCRRVLAKAIAIRHNKFNVAVGVPTAFAA